MKVDRNGPTRIPYIPCIYAVLSEHALFRFTEWVLYVVLYVVLYIQCSIVHSIVYSIVYVHHLYIEGHFEVWVVSSGKQEGRARRDPQGNRCRIAGAGEFVESLR
jgi:hypothetical protein